MRPALSAVEDPRLGGVKSHFDAARSELALGTPTALRQSVHGLVCAVEGAVKVLLAQRGIKRDEKDPAFKLFASLVAAEIVPHFMQFSILAAASPRNKRGGHGAGEAPHEVPPAIAKAVLASAAVALTKRSSSARGARTLPRRTRATPRLSRTRSPSLSGCVRLATRVLRAC